VVDGLDVVAVRVVDELGVVARGIVLVDARLDAGPPARLQGSPIEGVDGR
jgi:hypothetical protein